MNPLARHLLAIDAAVEAARTAAQGGQGVEAAAAEAGRAFTAAGGIWMGGIHSIRSFESDFPYHDAVGKSLEAWENELKLEERSSLGMTKVVRERYGIWLREFQKAWPD